MSDEAMLVWAVSISYRKVSYGPVLSSVNPSYLVGSQMLCFLCYWSRQCQVVIGLSDILLPHTIRSIFYWPIAISGFIIIAICAGTYQMVLVELTFYFFSCWFNMSHYMRLQLYFYNCTKRLILLAKRLMLHKC